MEIKNLKITELLNVSIVVPYNSGFMGFKTVYGRTVRLSTDTGQGKQQLLVGRLIDPKASPANGNFQARAVVKGVAKKDWVWVAHEWHKDDWREVYSWKLKMNQGHIVQRPERKNGEKTGKMIQIPVKKDFEFYVEMSWTQNKNLMDCIKERKGLVVMPLKAEKAVTFYCPEDGVDDNADPDSCTLDEEGNIVPDIPKAETPKEKPPELPEGEVSGKEEYPINLPF